MEIIVQILGIIAIVVSILSMTFKNKASIMLFNMIYNILTLISYLLLGEYLGCILVGVLILKCLVYYLFALKKLKPKVYVLIIFEVAILTISIIFWKNWVDLFIIANSLINTYFSWQDNVTHLKISAVVCACLLILYDVFVGAYSYIISEVLYGGTALISLLVMTFKKNKQIKETDNEN